MQHLPLAALGLIFGVCATPYPAAVAQTTPSKPAAATATAAKDGQNPVICARVETTGSRLAEKVCHTASEWAALRSQGTDDLNNRTQRQFSAPGGN